jgi:hypothetical protein
MKILLINPPRSPHNKILEYAPPEAKPFIHKKLIGPPLGLLTVAAALDDHDVDLLEIKAEYDLNPAAPPLEELVRHTSREVPARYGGSHFYRLGIQCRYHHFSNGQTIRSAYYDRGRWIACHPLPQ